MGVFMVATPIEFTFVFISVFNKIHRNYSLCIKILLSILLNTEIITLEVETDQYSQINFLKSKVHGTLISAWNDQYLLVRQEMDGPSYYFRVFGLLTEKKLNPADAGITFTVRILSLVLPG